MHSAQVQVTGHLATAQTSPDTASYPMITYIVNELSNQNPELYIEIPLEIYERL